VGNKHHFAVNSPQRHCETQQVWFGCLNAQSSEEKIE
jgi:hypothetical protein